MPKTRPETRPDTKERSIYYQSNPVNYQDSIQMTTNTGERSSSRQFQVTSDPSKAPSRSFKVNKYDFGMPEMAMPYNVNGFTINSRENSGGSYADLADIARAEAASIEEPSQQTNVHINSIGQEQTSIIESSVSQTGTTTNISPKILSSRLAKNS